MRFWEIVTSAATEAIASGGLNPPGGYLFLIDDDGAFLTDDDGAYLLTEV